MDRAETTRMRVWAKLSLQFTASALLFAIVGAPVSVYVAGMFEPAWGRGPSTQVLWWIAFGWAVAAVFLCGLGAAAARPTQTVGALFPIATGLAFFPIAWAIGAVATDSRLPTHRGGCALSMAFNLNDRSGSIEFDVFLEADGYLAGVDVAYNSNSAPVPRDPQLVEPPYHVHGHLAQSAEKA